MRLNNSKKELARIISENGGWREGADTCSCDHDGYVSFFVGNPTRNGGSWLDNGDCEYIGGTIATKYEKIKNWHQTILSREEYFHLYPAPDAVASTEPAPEPVVDAKPTIEQLAADHRNLKDYADRKQQEANVAKADADAKLAELVAAGKAIGLALSVCDVEPELVITDWRDLRVGDEVEAKCHEGVSIGFITEMEPNDYDGERPFLFQPAGCSHRWCTSQVFRFIRRP